MASFLDNLNNEQLKDRMDKFPRYFQWPLKLAEYYRHCLNDNNPNRPPDFHVPTANLIYKVFVLKEHDLFKPMEGNRNHQWGIALFSSKSHLLPCCGARATQKRGDEHLCKDRKWHSYKHVSVWGKLTCLICCQGFSSPKQICLHYLTHNFADVLALGLNPFILRYAVEGPQQKKRYRTYEMLKRLQQAEQEKDEMNRQLRLLQEEQNENNRLDIKDFEYTRTKEDAPLFVPDKRIWDLAELAVTDKQLHILNAHNLNHRMFLPFWAPEDTLMRHTVDYEGTQILVGVFNRHVTILYPKNALDILPGGVGLLMT
jgi:hypothetical protein